jgi:multiple sugar transport system substrate-binding protein
MKNDVFGNKLATVTRSGKGVPDIALIASESVSTYSSQKMLDSWDNYLKDSKVTSDNYLEEAWNVGTVDGKQYGLPATMGSWVMYYNKDLVDKYAPGAADDNIITYAEIEKAAAAAKADGVYAYGFSWPMQNFNNLYLQMGGKFSEGGKPTIDNEKAVATFDEFKKLASAGYMNKKGEDTTMLFKNGKIMFMPEGTWMLAEMNKITNFKWAETFTPQWDATNLVQGSGADQFALFKSKDRSDAKIKSAVKFIEWLQGNQLEWVKSGANPTALGMLDNQEYTNMPQSFLLKSDQARKAVTIITDPGSSYVFGEVDAAAWDIISGKVDTKEQLKKMQQTVNDKMNQ